MNRPVIEFNLDGELASLRLIFISLFIAPLLYILILSAGILTATSIPTEMEDDNLLTILIGAALFLSVVAPQVRKTLLKGDGARTLDQGHLQRVFNRYRIAVIVSLVLWDGVATLGFIAAALFGQETICYSLSILSIIGMFLARPTETEFRTISA